MTFKPGERVSHFEFGQGVVISAAGGYARVFFPQGERQVPVSTLVAALSHNERVVASIGSHTDSDTKPGSPGRRMNYPFRIQPAR